MACIIRYLVLELNNKDIRDVQAFVEYAVPRTPGVTLEGDAPFTYDAQILKVDQLKNDLGARLHLIEVLIHELSVTQEHPLLMVYREGKAFNKLETEFLLKRIERIMVRLCLELDLKVEQIEATSYWSMLVLRDFMAQFKRRFQHAYPLTSTK